MPDQFRRTAEEHFLAAQFTGTRAHVENLIGRQHHLRIMFYHNQRIPGVADALQDADHALDVARMQADAGLIQHKQCIDQRGAQRRGEIDTLYLTAAQGARLPVQCQITQAHIHQIIHARADFLH